MVAAGRHQEWPLVKPLINRRYISLRSDLIIPKVWSSERLHSGRTVDQMAFGAYTIIGVWRDSLRR
jgi:hypothetical protein